jgi:hypothetical protein
VLTCRHTSTRGEGRQFKRGACLAPSSTGEAACHKRCACAAILQTHLCFDGLRMSDLEVRCQQPRPDAASFAIQVFHTATAAFWHVGNRKIDEDLRAPFFVEHIRTLTETFESSLTDAGKPLFRQLGRYLRRPRRE